MDKFQVSVLEYLGKLENGILVLLSIVHDGEYFESTYFYTDEQLVLTVSEELEEKLGCKIQDDPDYVELIKSIITKVVPFQEMWGKIDEVNFERWMQIDEEGRDEELE